MKPLTRNWIITGVIFSVAVLFTVFCGLGIAHMRKDDVRPSESSTQAPSDTSEETAAPSTSADVIPTDTAPEPDTTAAPPSSDQNKSTGTIRLLSEEELTAISERDLDIPQTFYISGDRDSENRASSAVDFYNTFSLKFKRVYVFNPQTVSDLSFTFILTHEYGHTNNLLDVLKEYGVRATFFVDWDYLENNSEIIERILLEKHELGSLGASNPEPGIGLYGINDVMNDFYNMNTHVENVYDRTLTKIYFNHDKFKDQTVVLTTQMGYEVIFYSAYYEDDDPSKTIDEAAFLQSLKNQVHKGAIYRLHSVNAATPRVLYEFLSWLNAEGYHPGLIN